MTRGVPSLRKPKLSPSAKARAAARKKALAQRTSGACAAPRKGRKVPKGCVPARPKRPVVTPKAKLPVLPANPAVSAAAPLPAPGAPPVALPPPPVAAPNGDTTPAVVAPPVSSPGTTALPIAQRFEARDAERLLWRAGFGPRPGDVDRFVAMGLEAAVASLVRPTGEARLVGPAPCDEEGRALAPTDRWGHDHCWWLDRMVRSDQPLAERMTLVWHDWFATSREGVGRTQLMLDQNALLRRHALGAFPTLLTEVTRDPAMLAWLDGIDNRHGALNENHARELMELFTLGADRTAYTEADVRELARVMTGWRADWREGTGLVDFRFDATRHDAGTKNVFGRTGAFGYDDAARLCVEHPAHAGFLVERLWGTFVAAPLAAATRAALEARYVGGGRELAPVLEAILLHPALYDGGALAKPPVVFCAGLLRMLGRGVDRDDWAWLCRQAGQQLFLPPNASGWDDDAWLDTSTWRARWNIVAWAIDSRSIDPWGATPYDQAETPELAVERALAWAGGPTMSPEQHDGLLHFARTSLPAVPAQWQLGPLRAERQNALRLLVLTAADWQLA